MSAVLDAPAPKAARMKRVPGLRMMWIIRQLRRGNFTHAVKNSYTVPDAFDSYFGPFRVIFIHHPDLVEALLVKNHKSYHKDSGYTALRRVLGNGLLTNEGEHHLRQRRMIQPAFHKKRIDTYGACMVQYARDRAARWQDGQRIDFHAEMMYVTLRVIAKTMFNADVADKAERVAHALDVIFSVQDRYTIEWVGKIFDALPLQSTRDLHRCLRELDEIIYGFIREHREAQEDAGDLLSMLLDAQSEDDGSRMSDQQLRDECLTLFLAGHETTAVALSWTFYLLSQHPEVEARLHEELDRVLAGRDATVDDVARLPYTRQVLTESMRIYPPAYAVGRMAIEDNDLCGHKVRKGDTVIVSQYITHRQPEWFPDPERFDPDRWAPGGPASDLPKFAYFPFGGGARKCIGDQFAWMEGILLLATFAQEWKARLAPGHVVSSDPGVTLRPRNGMPMILERRK